MVQVLPERVAGMVLLVATPGAVSTMLASTSMPRVTAAKSGRRVRVLAVVE